MEFKTVIIGGLFDEQDCKELMEVVRRIERRRPHIDYVVSMDDPKGEESIEKTLRMARETFPALPDEEPVIWEIPKEKL